MIIIDYQAKNHRAIMKAAVAALQQGRAVVYPTDTSYGLAVDASNVKAVNRLYKIKGRDFKKPVHVVVPSVACAKKIVQWNLQANRLVSKFWPGALTLVLGMRGEGRGMKRLSAGTKTLGLRMPKHKIALDFVKQLKKPITATSANVSGGGDAYDIHDILRQFEANKLKPDLVINAGALPRRKPSTVVKIENGKWEVLRQGPVSEKQIKKTLS